MDAELKRPKLELDAFTAYYSAAYGDVWYDGRHGSAFRPPKELKDIKPLPRDG